MIAGNITEEKIFENELEIFRTEVETGIQFFYAYLSINGTAANNKEVLKALNRTPLFWNTSSGALQQSSIIVLGRIFDQGSPHNIDKLLGLAQKGVRIFSKKSLADRKKDVLATSTSLNEYLADAYTPTTADFRKLRKLTSKKRKIYEAKYREIRHKVFAHKISEAEEIVVLFSKTNIREMELMFIFLHRLYNVLWQLYYNGQKPSFRLGRYSSKQMLKCPTGRHQSKTLQERVSLETKQVLTTLASPSHLKKNKENGLISSIEVSLHQA